MTTPISPNRPNPSASTFLDGSAAPSADQPAQVGGSPVSSGSHNPLSWIAHMGRGRGPKVNNAPPANAPNPPPYWGGSKAGQDQRMGVALLELNTLQASLAQVNGDGPDRTFHKEGDVVASSFELYAHPALPKGVPAAGLFDPAMMEQIRHITARVSYGRGDSNLHSILPDVRGLAVRFETADGRMQDLTATNAEVPFAHNPAELLAFGIATKDLVKDGKDATTNPSALLKDKLPDLARELRRLEPDVCPDDDAAVARAAQMLADAVPSTFPVHSLASTTFWSGAPIKFGDKLVKFAFRPVEKTTGLPNDNLLGELAGHKKGVEYELCVQFYTDPTNTPLDPPSHWNTPLIPMGRLHLDTRSIGTVAQQQLKAEFTKKEGFNPGHAFKGNEPYGLNALRAELYSADAKSRGVSPKRCPFGYG
jgi:hypothetical protein